jgi:cob(I)alamin adenosyltransferase
LSEEQRSQRGCPARQSGYDPLRRDTELILDEATYTCWVKIYTKTGDSGETALLGGKRVSKADPRVAAYGEVDELNAWLGLVRSIGSDAGLAAMLERIQRDLFAIGARLADPGSQVAHRVAKTAVTGDDVKRLEDWIDLLESEVPVLRRFILAGGSRAGASLHVARTICRRAERTVVSLGTEHVEPEILVYLNRLSDLLFVMARVANRRDGAPEFEW